MRSAFWASKYNEVKLANAKLPILLRECEGVPAKLTATYGAARSGTRTIANADGARKRWGWVLPLRQHLRLTCVLARVTEMGVEKSMSVEGLDSAAFGKALQELIK